LSGRFIQPIMRHFTDLGTKSLQKYLNFGSENGGRFIENGEKKGFEDNR